MEAKVTREDGLRKDEAQVFIKFNWFDHLAGNAMKVFRINADHDKILLVERVFS